MTIDAPNIRSWMESSVRAWEQFTEKHGTEHLFGLHIEPWLLEHGKPMGPRIDLPPGVEYGKAKECFTNAFNLAVYGRDGQGTGFTYAEGFAYTPGLIACHHAWVVNEKGEVIDPTWMDGGKLCPFCLGDGTTDEAVEWDEEDGEEIGWEEQECWSCKGSGESDHEHPSREGTEYLGITVERDTLVKWVLRKGTYGVLPDYMDELSKLVTA